MGLQDLLLGYSMRKQAATRSCIQICPMPIITTILRIPRAIWTLLTRAAGIFSTREMALREIRLRRSILEVSYMRQLYLVNALIRSQSGCQKA